MTTGGLEEEEVEKESCGQHRLNMHAQCLCVCACVHAHWGGRARQRFFSGYN